MSEAISDTEGLGAGAFGVEPVGQPYGMDLTATRVIPAPRPPASRLAEPPARFAPTLDTGPLRLDQLPVLLLTGPGIGSRVRGELGAVSGIERREVEHVVAGRVRRPEVIGGVRLSLSEAGLDRVAGLVAFGADHSRGCLGAYGVSLGDATRYAARLERLGLRAEKAWHGLAEGHYVLDAEPWNLRRLVDEPAIAAAEDLLGTLCGSDAPGHRPTSWLVLLGPTCTTAGP